MNVKLKKVALFLVLAMLFNIFAPTIKVIAADYDETINYSSYYQIQLNTNNGIEISSDDKTATITYDNGKATITGDNLTKRGNELYSTTKFVAQVEPSANYNYQIWYGGNQITLDTLNSNLSNLIANDRKNVDFIFEKKEIGKVTFNNAKSISGNETNMTVSYDNGSATITGTGLKTESDDGGKYIYTYDVPQSLTITVTPNDGYSSRIYYNGNQISSPFNLPVNGRDNINYDISFDKNNSVPQVGQNKTATINLEHLTGTYEHIYTDKDGVSKTDEVSYIPEGDADGFVDISINGNMLQPGATAINYNSEEGATTVTFSFTHLWHLKLYDDIIINDGTTDHTYHVSDYLDYDNQKQWLDHYDGQMVTFDIKDVPLSDTYTVTVKLGRQWDSHIANFLWTGDPAQEYVRDRDTGEYLLDENGNKIKGEDYIGHAHLETIGLEYTVGGTKYTYTEADFDKGSFDKDYVEYDSDQSLGYDEGALVIPAGSKVTMRITPEYGYQVLASNLAKSGLSTTDSGVCEFSFTIGGGAAYFTADVVAVDDEVKATSDKVSSGDIVLADGSLTTGTARLTVSDIELDSDKIAAFEEKAGEYEIKSYLDIDLDQVFYRGTADSVWSNKIHELDDYATITLKLEDGVDGNDIVIVHNINDGDEYEIIEIESYDAETNTITFKTKSFSNYAIATKNDTTTETEEEAKSEKTKTSTSPQTGDNIRIVVAILIIAVFGIVLTSKHKQKRKVIKH